MLKNCGKFIISFAVLHLWQIAYLYRSHNQNENKSCSNRIQFYSASLKWHFLNSMNLEFQFANHNKVFYFAFERNSWNERFREFLRHYSLFLFRDVFVKTLTYSRSLLTCILCMPLSLHSFLWQIFFLSVHFCFFLFCQDEVS